MADLVIAIDEAGDFRADSKLDHFYIAAIVRSAKEDQFRRWEAGIPPNRRKDGEVKGGYLTDDQQHDFVREVICARPRVIITRCAVSPGTHAPGDIAAHQGAAVQSAKQSAIEFRAGGNARLAAEALGLARWIQRMREGQYLKLAAQTECVAQSLAHVVGHSISERFDTELTSLRYKIDQGLLGDDPKARLYWKRSVAMHLRHLPEDRALVVLDTWQESGHPFQLMYCPDGWWSLDPLFDERCEFLSSKDSFELRIADIVASIHRQFHLSTSKRWKQQSAYERMRRSRAFAGRGELLKLRLGPPRSAR